jgi:hypothetical protein
MMICFDYIVVLIVHKRFVVKEIFLDIQVGSNSEAQNQKLIYIYFITQSSPLYFMAVKYGALLTQIPLDLEMELYLRTEFTQISFVKNYILNFVNLF